MNTSHLQTYTGLSSYKPPTVSSLNDVISEIHGAFSGDQVDVDHVTEILESYKSNPLDWKQFAKFDRYKYTRNLVTEGNSKFNVMLLCWGPSHQSSIHDHSNSHCFMKMLSGSLNEIRYEWPNGTEDDVADGMKMIGTSLLGDNGVCYINDSLGLHRVSNASDSEVAVSLHVYCPPFQTCKTFEESSGRNMNCNVTFYSKFGEKIKHSS